MVNFRKKLYVFKQVYFSVLNCLYDSISMLLRKNVEKRQMLKQLDGVLLCVDEICDGGIVMELEPQGTFLTCLSTVSKIFFSCNR